MLKKTMLKYSLSFIRPKTLLRYLKQLPSTVSRSGFVS